MQHFSSLEEISLQNSWLTIGSFDGVHLGHQAIVRQLTAGAHAEGLPAVVLTFFPHPAVVLGKRNDPFYLSSPEEKAALLGELGVDVVVTHPFNLNVSLLSPNEFMSNVTAHLHPSHLMVGYDFALGRGRTGDVVALSKIGEELGYYLEVIQPVTSGSEVISSSQIRQALRDGNVEEAARLLGRPYAIRGEIIHGDGRGKSIGIPTANLQVWAERAIPKAGVYVCQATFELSGEEKRAQTGVAYGAVANVGVRPTFEKQAVAPRVEAHLLDFDRDLYGQQIRLTFLARLRDEQRFPDVQTLVKQIHADIERGKEFLSRR